MIAAPPVFVASPGAATKFVGLSGGVAGTPAGELVAVTVAMPSSVFNLLVVIVAVELVLAATPVTVTKPVRLNDTSPDAVAEPPHLYLGS